MQHRNPSGRLASYAYYALFAFAVVTAGTWLVAGLLPALASGFGGFHADLHGVGPDGLLSEIAGNIAQASHSSWPAGDVILDYVFSGLNLVLAILLIKLRPRDTTARLLGLALVGTAIAFNLQSHDSLQVVPTEALGAIDVWHLSIHVVSGICYVFALILFPTGRLPVRNRFLKALTVPLLVLVTLIATMLSLITTEDHTTGLVILFGIFVPVTGVLAQSAHYVVAESSEEKRQSKLLIWASVAAFSIAVPLMIISAEPGHAPSRTLLYELPPLSEGIYFFRCDPHPVEMTGTLTVTADGPRTLALSSLNSRFDNRSVTLAAGSQTQISFTNLDVDLHNVAVYTDATASEPLFIGAEFSGSTLGIAAFRIFRVILFAIPIALIIGLVRYRLWNVERAIKRTLIYGAGIAAIGAAYVGAILGLGKLIGRGERVNVVLSLVVTAIFAAAFQPLRELARRLANRIVYGKRATPYEALSELSERIGETYAIDEVAPRLAEAVARGTLASTSEVWLRVGDELARVASWPERTTATATRRPVSATGDGAELGSTRAVPVRDRGELLGSISITKPPGEELTEIEERLLTNVASQARLMFKNARLTLELEEKIRELRASRQRIVSAQDVERRRIERNIHDGAQQHLVAISAKLRLAQSLSKSDPQRANRLLEELQTDTQQTLQAVRDLARGIYPPVLADKGLVHALEAHARRCPVPVRVGGADVGRHEPEIENAVYFCCLEAIQNSIKHAGSPIEVKLTNDDGHLCFSVIDEGPGFELTRNKNGTGLANMSDRVQALRGNLKIISAPGAPTTVKGRIPSAGAAEKMEQPPSGPS